MLIHLIPPLYNNDSKILKDADIRQIFVNGKTAEKYFEKYTKPLINKMQDVCRLPLLRMLRGQ